MKIMMESFGKTAAGEKINRFLLTDGDCTAAILSLGGIVQSLIVPDRNGNPVDVVLGFDTVEAYEQQTCYIGALLGRAANRIVNSEKINGSGRYNLQCNDRGICHLHGGICGFDRKVWKAAVTPDGLTLSYTSSDGEEGYPGTLQVSVTYQLKDRALSMTYRAVSDKETICNLSNHMYFNLAGHSCGNVGKHQIQVWSNQYTPLGISGAPEGEIHDVTGTPMDLRIPRAFDEHWNDDFGQIKQARGYDHNYLIDGTGMRPFAKVWCDQTGIVMQTDSDMPAMQLYTGNYLENLPLGKQDAMYGIRSGFCIETQYPPNAINCPNYIQPILASGEEYLHTTVYTFSHF